MEKGTDKTKKNRPKKQTAANRASILAIIGKGVVNRGEGKSEET